MTHHTQAELFIKTLEELRDDNRERQTARMRSRIKIHATKFMETFRTDFIEADRAGQKAARRSPMARAASGQSRDERLCTFSFMTRQHQFQE